MTDLGEFDLPLSRIEESMLGWVREALELRHGAGSDPDGPITSFVDPRDGSYAVIDMLRRVTARSDRVDELLSKATIAKFRAKRTASNAAFEAERAFDQAATSNASRRSGENWSTKEERKAEASLDSFEQRRVAHQAETLVSVTTEAYDVLYQIKRQLGDIRADLRAILHNIEFQASIDR